MLTAAVTLLGFNLDCDYVATAPLAIYEFMLSPGGAASLTLCQARDTRHMTHKSISHSSSSNKLPPPPVCVSLRWASWKPLKLPRLALPALASFQPRLSLFVSIRWLRLCERDTNPAYNFIVHPRSDCVGDRTIPHPLPLPLPLSACSVANFDTL